MSQIGVHCSPSSTRRRPRYPSRTSRFPKSFLLKLLPLPRLAIHRAPRRRRHLLHLLHLQRRPGVPQQQHKEVRCSVSVGCLLLLLASRLFYCSEMIVLQVLVFYLAYGYCVRTGRLDMVVATVVACPREYVQGSSKVCILLSYKPSIKVRLHHAPFG